MKNLLLLLVSIVLTSCTAEPLPENMIKNENKVTKYLIEWDSNQIDPYMDVTVRRNGIDTKYDNILSKSYDIILYPGDLLMIGINYKSTVPRSECNLSISRYSPLHLESGEYNPDSTEQLFEEKTTANGIGFNGYVDEKGNIKYN